MLGPYNSQRRKEVTIISDWKGQEMNHVNPCFAQVVVLKKLSLLLLSARKYVASLSNFIN